MATKKRSRSQKNFCIFYIFWYFPISAVPCEELYKSLNVFVKHLPYIHLELYVLLFAHINAVRQLNCDIKAWSAEIGSCKYLEEEKLERNLMNRKKA